jgi:hypothetical protein
MKSEARLRQLEALKLARRRSRGFHQGPRAETLSNDNRLVQDAAPTYRQFMAEVRRISMAGIMPTQERFDFAKPAVWQSANELCARFGVTWDEMAAMVDLTPRRVEDS